MNRLSSAATMGAFVLSAVFVGGCASEGGASKAPDAPAASAPAPQQGSAMPSSIVDPYVKIGEALSKDSMEGVKANAGQIATAATALGAPAMKIDTAAVQVAAATEIADAREKFGTLSDAVVTYMDGMHLTPPEGVRVAMCPMKQKPWMQKGSDIENPYFGSAMLTCGSFR
jgi:Cu(I)/Ag(I) efflux system membrane fusion protein